MQTTKNKSSKSNSTVTTASNKPKSMKNKANMWGGEKAMESLPSKKSSSKGSASMQSKGANGKKSIGKNASNKDSELKEPKSRTASSVKGAKMNSKTEFAQDMTALNDVEIVSDVLTTHKGLVKLYGTALCESSCENLRELVGQHLTECGEDQFDVFLYMSERNLYPTEEATAQKLNKAKQKFLGYEKQMKI